jgi:hypothetical protein
MYMNSPSGGIGPSPNFTMPEGIDPRLAQMYQNAGLQPGDKGQGFADWQYWQNDALKNAGGDWGYIQNRLGSDLMGNGPDQPTGTPGQGRWSTSGQQQPQQMYGGNTGMFGGGMYGGGMGSMYGGGGGMFGNTGMFGMGASGGGVPRQQAMRWQSGMRPGFSPYNRMRGGIGPSWGNRMQTAQPPAAQPAAQPIPQTPDTTTPTNG